MDEEARYSLVRSLTRASLEALRPDALATFSEDFQAAANRFWVPGVEAPVRSFQGKPQPLDATLVAGMFFQVVFEAEALPASAPERVSFVRTKAQKYLVDQLAGQITLDQFGRLLELIDENVHRYFARARESWLSPAPPPPAPSRPAAAPPPPSSHLDLRQALAELPWATKGRRKLTQDTLLTFLQEHDSGWFRLLDLEERFGINKKTAWLYLDLLLKAGILVHNGEKANRVRYTLAARYGAPGNASSRPAPAP